MISTNGLKRKSSSSTADNNNKITITTKRFRGTTYNGKIHQNKHENQSNKINQQEMTSDYRQLQYELQCQEALLVLMQKLKTNQRIFSQTNNLKQRTTTTTKQPSNSTPTKSPHPNQYTVNRSNNNSQQPSVPLPQTTRQSNNSILPTTATRLPTTTVPPIPTKNSSATSTTNNSSKNNGITTDQHLINAKLALRKQLEQTLLQIPTPKPSTCDLTYIPGINGWSEFLSLIGLEQAYNTSTNFINRRLLPDISINSPYICAQCGTDWSVTWHEISSDMEKILCDRCRKTSQKKILKQDHSNRLRQAFMKALQQEKELDAKFHQQSTTVKRPSSQTKHSNKSLSTKTNSNHHHHHPTHKHTGKTNSIKHSLPTDTFGTLPTNEQIELFQKHFLSNMFQFNIANQAAALAAKSTQQQALAASLPAMAASLMHQGNPAQYLLDMIPQAAKQQQHHRHSK